MGARQRKHCPPLAERDPEHDPGHPRATRHARWDARSRPHVGQCELHRSHVGVDRPRVGAEVRGAREHIARRLRERLQQAARAGAAQAAPVAAGVVPWRRSGGRQPRRLRAARLPQHRRRVAARCLRARRWRRGRRDRRSLLRARRRLAHRSRRAGLQSRRLLLRLLGRVAAVHRCGEGGLLAQQHLVRRCHDVCRGAGRLLQRRGHGIHACVRPLRLPARRRRADSGECEASGLAGVDERNDRSELLLGLVAPTPLSEGGAGRHRPERQGKLPSPALRRPMGGAGHRWFRCGNRVSHWVRLAVAGVGSLLGKIARVAGVVHQHSSPARRLVADCGGVSREGSWLRACLERFHAGVGYGRRVQSDAQDRHALVHVLRAAALLQRLPRAARHGFHCPNFAVCVSGSSALRVHAAHHLRELHLGRPLTVRVAGRGMVFGPCGPHQCADDARGPRGLRALVRRLPGLRHGLAIPLRGGPRLHRGQHVARNLDGPLLRGARRVSAERPVHLRSGLRARRRHALGLDVPLAAAGAGVESESAEVVRGVALL
mmetsp:Transcript_108069/g.312271  ORF Transcript_108069/g.312271 Transcript_108069/m.312271 type:complete len:546 (-) Transcript_108069:745-2382(-)